MNSLSQNFGKFIANVIACWFGNGASSHHRGITESFPEVMLVSLLEVRNPARNRLAKGS